MAASKETPQKTQITFGKFENVDMRVAEVLVLGAPHPDSPAGQAQAIPLHVAVEAMPGGSIF